MSLNHLSIHNFIAISEASISLSKKINIFTGMNGAGKSSLACSLEYLFTGRTRGLEFKKDAPALIHDGAKQAEIVATYDDGVTIRRARTASGETLRFIANGKPEVKELPEPWRSWPAIALNPALYFTDLETEGRRAALAKVLLKDQSAQEPAIRAHLEERYKIPSEIAAYFAKQAATRGFKLAQSAAVEQRRLAKRTETELEADEPTADLILAGRHYDLTKISVAAVQDQLKEVQAERDKVLTDMGAQKARGTPRAKIEAELKNARDDYAALIRPTSDAAALKRDIARYEQEIESEQKKIRESEAAIKVSQAEEKLTIPKIDFVLCPVLAEQVKCPVPQADRDKVLKTFEQRKKIGERIISENHADIAKSQSTIRACRNAIEVAREDLEAIGTFERRAASATEMIAKLTELLSSATDESQPERDFEQEIKGLDERLSIGRYLILKIEEYERQVERWQKFAATGKEVADRIEMYNRLDDALSPNGIPVLLMQEGIKDFRDRLLATGKDFNAVVGLSEGDFLPTYNNRPYVLCSESEQWRAQVLFQDAIAHLARVPYLIIDRADILDRELKVSFTNFLLRVAPDYEKIFVFATESDTPPSPSAHPDVQIWQVTQGSVKPV